MKKVFLMDKEHERLYFEIKSLFTKNGCILPDDLRILYDDAGAAPKYILSDKAISLTTNPEERYYSQFVFQLAHELTHAFHLQKNSPAILYRHSSAWISEIIACNISFYALDSLGFTHYMEIHRHFKTPINFAQYHIANNIKAFECNQDEAKQEPLVYYIYDNRESYNIWDLLQLYEKWERDYFEKPLSPPVSLSNNSEITAESLPTVKVSFIEYLKTISSDLRSYAMLFNCGLSSEKVLS